MMFAWKLGIISILFILIFMISTMAPVLAADDYLPGVSKGQYVKYGNFVGTGPGMDAYSSNDWMKYEVTGVNVSEVTLLLTGQFKNGTAILGNGDSWVYDVTFILSVNATPSTYSPIMAGNLTKGDLIGTYVISPLDAINDTQTRTYLGVSRSVNILETIHTNSTENSENRLTCIYDQQSGMLLELNGESTVTQPAQVTRQFSYSITETNIFGPNAPVLGLSPLYVYVIIASVVAVIVVALVVLKLRSNRGKRHRR
jgi:hypothetical protein